MNILFVSPKIPKLDGVGYQVLAFKRLQCLSKTHKVAVLCFGSPSADASDIDAIAGLGASVHIVPSLWLWSLVGVVLAFPAYKTPLQCALYFSPLFKAKLQKIIKSARPDYIYCSTIRLMPYLARHKGEVILEMVDSMGLNFSRRLSNAGFFRKFIYWIEYLKVSRYERMLVELDHVKPFVVSELDRDFIGEQKVLVLPLGVDVAAKSGGGDRRHRKSIIFSGNMSYEPNVQAVLWFVENCWSDIRKSNSKLEFFICGANPSKKITDLASIPGIVVTGRVESIQNELIERAAAIAPMQSGSGMQFKILEAMSASTPVVATTLGRGVIKASDGVDIFIADSPEDFVDAVCTLLLDPELARSVGEAGCRYVEINHSWDAINTRFKEINNL